jgi:hypothetical protein
MNLGGRREGGKDGRTDWTNGTQGAHIKSLEEEDQKEKESPSRATQNNNKITYNLLRAALQHLIPSWSTTPSTYDLLETTHTHILVSSLSLSLYMCIYLRWKNGEDGED